MSEDSRTFTAEEVGLEVGFIQTAPTALLVAAARGELDFNRLALVELASRGLDLDGVWVGFERAREIHGFAR